MVVVFDAKAEKNVHGIAGSTSEKFEMAVNISASGMKRRI
jgi:hypothetical protein